MVKIHIIINKHTKNKYGQVFLLRFSPLQLLLLPFGSYTQSEEDLSLAVYQKPWSK